MGAHHAEAGPKAVHVLRILDKDQNHHPLDQVLDWGLVTAESGLKHTFHQRGDKLLHNRTHTVTVWVVISCVIVDVSVIVLPLWVWAATVAVSAILCFWYDVAGSCYSNALLTLICQYPGEIGRGWWKEIMENGVDLAAAVFMKICHMC